MNVTQGAGVEYLRPKTIPEQLIALGTVSQVLDHQLKLQITGGIVCLVDKYSVCDTYTELIKQHEREGCPKESNPPSLSQLFKRGQQYVCKITEKRPRKGYADAIDILASLDPTEIQEDNIVTMFAIPQIPIQCAITSLEDHGYRCDIGFKGLTGFLKYDEAEEYCKRNNNGKKFLVGQVIRCCTKESLTPESRAIQLSLSKTDIKQSEFSKEKTAEHALTPKCILPGSRGYLTVMKVKKDGLVVNFLDEFGGFVSASHLKEEWHNPRKDYKISDQLKCTVLYYNSITKTFALSVRPKASFKKTSKHLIENYHIGQIIKNAQVFYLEGTKAVHFKVDGEYSGIANVRDALDQDVGTMTRDEIHTALDSTYPDDSIHRCRIKSINLADLILVLSLREDFLELPVVSPEELKPADFIEAKVKKHVKDGIVVSFGLNLRAIILNNHLHDYLNTKVSKIYPIGKTIKCRVLKVDFDKQPARIYLTNKEQLMNSELTIVDSYDKSFRGESVSAIIDKVKSDGVIVELFNNVKGFIPRIFLSSVDIKSVGGLFAIGQVTDCVIYRVEPHRQSMLLGNVPLQKIIEAKKEKKKAKKTKKSPKEDVADKTDENELVKTAQKSRKQRTEEARLREEKLREVEKLRMDPKRQPQTMMDFEQLVLKNPNSAESWNKYSTYFLDNVETEKARIVCRRALKTINFRFEKEKLKVWLQLIKIEAKYGGTERLQEVIEEAAQTNDKIQLFTSASKVLVACNELDEAEKLLEKVLRSGGSKSPHHWIAYILFFIEQRKDMVNARIVFEKVCKGLSPKDLVYFRSRFAHFEFKYGDVERGKTMFENLMSENPKRWDLWKVYEVAIRKYGTRQVDNEDIREQNEKILQRITEITS